MYKHIYPFIRLMLMLFDNLLNLISIVWLDIFFICGAEKHVNYFMTN